MHSASPVATGRSPSSQRPPSSTTFRSSAFPPARETTSRSTSGVDRHDLVGALEAFTDGVERLIDLGSVNGRLFLNNVSLGIYGEAVRQPAYRGAKARTLLRQHARCSGRARRHLGSGLVDDQAASTVIRLSSSCRTIPTPSIGRWHRARDRGSTAAVSGSSSSTHQAPAGRPGERGPRPRSRWMGRAGARRHRRRSGRSEPAARLRDPALRALRVRISSRHPGVSPVGPRSHDTPVNGRGRLPCRCGAATAAPSTVGALRRPARRGRHSHCRYGHGQIRACDPGTASHRRRRRAGSPRGWSLTLRLWMNGWRNVPSMN